MHAIHRMFYAQNNIHDIYIGNFGCSCGCLLVLKKPQTSHASFTKILCKTMTNSLNFQHQHGKAFNMIDITNILICKCLGIKHNVSQSNWHSSIDDGLFYRFWHHFPTILSLAINRNDDDDDDSFAWISCNPIVIFQFSSLIFQWCSFWYYFEIYRKSF